MSTRSAPQRRQRPMGQRDGMWRKFGRRASKAGRFGWKHRKKALGILALVSFAYVAVYFAYVGAVSVVQVLVVVCALVGAGLAKHHDNVRLRQSLKDQPRPRFSEQREWARGRGTPHSRPEPAAGTIYVRSHRRDGDGVTAHTRRAPGQQRKPRTWDRSPGTEADTRFFDLRESGYTGPIDQDGRAVTDQKQWEERGRRPEWRDRYEADRGAAS